MLISPISGYTFTNDTMFAQPHSGDMKIMGDPLSDMQKFEKEILAYFEKAKPQVAGRTFDTTKAESNFYAYQVWKGTCASPVPLCRGNVDTSPRQQRLQERLWHCIFSSIKITPRITPSLSTNSDASR